MKFPNFQNIANLAAALFLTLTTPDHLVADAYHAAGRAMDFNHDVSSLRAQEKEVEEEERAQALQEIKESLKGHIVEGVVLNFDGTLTPRRLAGLAAYIEVQQINAEKAYLAAHPPMIGVDNAAFMGALENPIDAFDQAYLKTQSQLAVGYTLKHKAGETLTDYERTVRRQDRQAHQRYIKRMAGYVGGAALGVGAALTAPVTVPGAVVIGALGGGLEGLALNDYEVKSKTDAALVVGSTILGAAVPGSGKAVQQAIKSTLNHAGMRAGDLAVSKAVTSKMVQTNASKGLLDHLGLEVPRVKTQLLERPIDSKYYSVAYKVKLQEGIHYPGVSDRIHFQECNKQLYMAMKSDSGLTAQLEASYPGLFNAVSPGPKGGFPIRLPPELDLTWHHNTYEKGLMELIPRSHHRSGGNVQFNLHPEKKGGMEIWGGGRK